MINENWGRWIRASVNKHFKTKADAAPAIILFIEGADYDVSKEKEAAELVINGPMIEEQSNNYYRLDIQIQIPVVVKRDDRGIYGIDKLAGRLSSMFDRTIPVYKYGDGPVDNQTFLGCLMLNDTAGTSVAIKNLGEINSDIQMQAAIVEGLYKIFLEG